MVHRAKGLFAARSGVGDRVDNGIAPFDGWPTELRHPAQLISSASGSCQLLEGSHGLAESFRVRLGRRGVVVAIGRVPHSGMKSRRRPGHATELDQRLSAFILAEWCNSTGPTVVEGFWLVVCFDPLSLVPRSAFPHSFKSFVFESRRISILSVEEPHVLGVALFVGPSIGCPYSTHTR